MGQPHAPEPLRSRLWPRGQIMPPGGRACNRKIGAANSIIRGCALLMAFTAWAEPALARSYLNCLAKKVVIVDSPRGSTSSNVEEHLGFWIDEAAKTSCKLDHEGRCRYDHNRVRPVRNCSRPAGVSGHTPCNSLSRTTRSCGSFMLFIRYSNSPSPAPKTKGCAQCLEEGRADRPREPSPGSELAPWERVLSE